MSRTAAALPRPAGTGRRGHRWAGCRGCVSGSSRSPDKSTEPLTKPRIAPPPGYGGCYSRAMPDAPGEAPANDSSTEIGPIEIGEIDLSADPQDEEHHPVRRSPLRRTLLTGLLAVAVVGAGFLGYE